MNRFLQTLRPLMWVGMTLALSIGSRQPAQAQTFDFERIEQSARDFTVVLKLKIEIEFGMQSTEQEQRLLGTIVTQDGMILFDGSFLANEHTLSAMSGMTIKTTPKRIEVQTLDGKKYQAEYVGVDRFTKFGFARITDAKGAKFTPVQFVKDPAFKVGSWVALYMLMPEFVVPQIAADIGMVSVNVLQPEKFTLTVGFNSGELAAVLFDEQLAPVGVLGALMDPTSANTDVSGMIESFNDFEMPLLGVVTGDRIAKLIADPPKQGEPDRSWLGITLQALTSDIAEFLNVNEAGGIIVNDVIKDSPADKASLKVGDIIYEFNGQRVEVDEDEKVPVFQRRIAEMAPGTQVEFSVLRPKDERVDTLKVLATLQNAPVTATNAPSYKNEALEFTVRKLVFGDFVRHNLEVGSLDGVVVSELREGGLAEIGGLQNGDIIQRIGDVPVASIEDAERAMKKIESEKPRELIFFIWRDNKTMFVNVKTDWRG